MASLTATIRGCSASRTRVSTSIGTTRARRDVVEHHRQVGGVGDRGEVAQQPGLRGLVVVRRHDEQAVHAEPLGGPGASRWSARCRWCRPRRRRWPGRRRRRCTASSTRVLLAVADGRRLPRRPEDDQAVVGLPVDQVGGQLLGAGEVDRAVLGERGDHRREHAPERPGGVGGHGRIYPARPADRSPRVLRRPRTAAPPTTTSTSPRPASAPSGCQPAPSAGAQVSPVDGDVDVGDHQPVGVRQEGGVDRSAADHPEATRARRAPRSTDAGPRAPSADQPGPRSGRRWSGRAAGGTARAATPRCAGP